MRQPLITILVLHLMIILVSCGEGQTIDVNFILNHLEVIIIIALFVLGLGFIYYDRRNGYVCINACKNRVRQCRIKIQNLKKSKENKKQQLSMMDDPPHSSKQTKQFFDTEKTYSEIEGPSMQETIPSPSNKEIIQCMQIIEETPQINLKDVFETKQNPNINLKKSKSKLRNRVQYRKSQIQQQAQVGLGFMGIEQTSDITQ